MCPYSASTWANTHTTYLHIPKPLLFRELSEAFEWLTKYRNGRKEAELHQVCFSSYIWKLIKYTIVKPDPVS